MLAGKEGVPEKAHNSSHKALLCAIQPAFPPRVTFFHSKIMSDISAAIMLSSACGSVEAGVVFYKYAQRPTSQSYGFVNALCCRSSILCLVRFVVISQKLVSITSWQNSLERCTYNLERLHCLENQITIPSATSFKPVQGFSKEFDKFNNSS